MSDNENFDYETREAEREDYTYSPAAGTDEETAESDRVDEPKELPDEGDGEVGLSVAPPARGTFIDNETGKRFTRTGVTCVSEADAERLLNQTLRGSSLFVRADS